MLDGPLSGFPGACIVSSFFEFSTTEAAPLPDQLGTIIEFELSPSVFLSETALSLAPSRPEVRGLALELHPSAQPWKDALVARLFIDGEGSPALEQARSTGIGPDGVGWTLSIACENGARGFQPAERVVQVGARIPGLWGGKTEARAQDLTCGGCQAVSSEVSTTLLVLIGAAWLQRRRRQSACES